MTIISSQRYIDYSIVSEKIAELEESEVEYITIPVVDAEMKDLEGNDLFVMTDKHHTREAAIELGIEVRYEVIDNEYNETGVELLEDLYMDSEWFYVESGECVW